MALRLTERWVVGGRPLELGSLEAGGMVWVLTYDSPEKVKCTSDDAPVCVCVCVCVC